jgi:hypothetical protein
MTDYQIQKLAKLYADQVVAGLDLAALVALATDVVASDVRRLAQTNPEVLDDLVMEVAYAD